PLMILLGLGFLFKAEKISKEIKNETQTYHPLPPTVTGEISLAPPPAHPTPSYACIAPNEKESEKENKNEVYENEVPIPNTFEVGIVSLTPPSPQRISETPATEDETPYEYVEVMPKYKYGGDSGLMHFIAENLNKSNVDSTVRGALYVKF